MHSFSTADSLHNFTSRQSELTSADGRSLVFSTPHPPNTRAVKSLVELEQARWSLLGITGLTLL